MYLRSKEKRREKRIGDNSMTQKEPEINPQPLSVEKIVDEILNHPQNNNDAMIPQWIQQLFDQKKN